MPFRIAVHEPRDEWVALVTFGRTETVSWKIDFLSDVDQIPDYVERAALDTDGERVIWGGLVSEFGPVEGRKLLPVLLADLRGAALVRTLARQENEPRGTLVVYVPTIEDFKLHVIPTVGELCTHFFQRLPLFTEGEHVTNRGFDAIYTLDGPRVLMVEDGAFEKARQHVRECEACQHALALHLKCSVDTAGTDLNTLVG